jgi:hypothetical protein
VDFEGLEDARLSYAAALKREHGAMFDMLVYLARAGNDLERYKVLRAIADSAHRDVENTGRDWRSAVDALWRGAGPSP